MGWNRESVRDSRVRAGSKHISGISNARFSIESGVAYFHDRGKYIRDDDVLPFFDTIHVHQRQATSLTLYISLTYLSPHHPSPSFTTPPSRMVTYPLTSLHVQLSSTDFHLFSPGANQ